MAWTYYCAGENLTLSAPTKEKLVEVVWQHVQDVHSKDNMTKDQIQQSVMQNATEQAA